MLMWRVLQRDGYHCQLRYHVCTGTATEVDHIVNVAKVLQSGGTTAQADDTSNLAAVCSPYHALKTEHERCTARAASNRQRAAQRPKRLRLPEPPHPGWWT
jgi:5-methylcytosine-specific restriction enzyme A